MAKKRQRVTIEDVAREAGVSMMTVSRVVNKTGRISEETIQHVTQVIKKLGYRPNRAARSLVTNRTYMVALVEPDITNPYFSEMFQGVEDVLRQEDYNVLVANTNETPSREKDILEKLDDTTVDGLIVCSSRLEDETLFPLLERFPSVVAVNRPVPEHVGSVVRSDYVPGYRAVMGFEHLHKQGYRRIGYLRLRHYDLYVDMRIFDTQLEKIGVEVRPEWSLSCAPQWKAGYEAGYQLLSTHPELDAVVGGNDLVALGAMRAALDLGRKIPDDLGIIGADDILLASQVSPPLTTLKTNSYEIGTMAARLLLPRMNGDMTYREYVYDTTLIVRGSTTLRH